MSIEKKAKINLISEQWSTGEVADPIKLMSMGTLRQDKKTKEWTVSYAESRATGMEGTTTSLSVLQNGTIHFSRKGAVQMDLIFESGNHFLTQMQTPFGLMDISIMTNEVFGKLDEQGGEIRLAYSLNFSNQEKISTKLKLNVETEN